jgi:hypothetical protein
MAKKCALWAVTAALLLGPRAVSASTLMIMDTADNDKITITCAGWGSFGFRLCNRLFGFC